jgi:hypothetical protein
MKDTPPPNLESAPPLRVPVVSPNADPWGDLIHHTLAHLPVAPHDASSLYREQYVRWAESRLPRPADPRRTLRQDADRLAALYDASPGAHGLQGFATLHRDLDAFGRTARFDFLSIPWDLAADAERAATLTRGLDPTLVELFRIALWGEIHAGYVTLHETLRPQYQATAAHLTEGLARLQARLPHLGDVDWRLSHPLGHAGRLVWEPDTAVRRITVGIPDPALQVPSWAPFVQGVHEFLLSEVHTALLPDGSTGPRDTRPDRPGWSGFFGPELLTLCLDARVLGTGPHADPLRRWLARYYPNREADLTPQLAAAGFTPQQPCPVGEDGFCSWLATGAVLPRPLRASFDSLLPRLGLISVE